VNQIICKSQDKVIRRDVVLFADLHHHVRILGEGQVFEVEASEAVTTTGVLVVFLCPEREHASGFDSVGGGGEKFGRV